MLVTGAGFRSPSVQLFVDHFAEVTVLSTHEQLLGGDSGQVFNGCEFPADPAYAPVIARLAQAVGREFARLGAVGRLGVDFAVGGDLAGRWEPFALEVNLRNSTRSGGADSSGSRFHADALATANGRQSGRDR